jgi:hypothetical protein
MRALNPAIPYVSAAKHLRDVVNDVVADLASEARARGASWVEIGKAINVGGTAVQKRYGAGLSSERLTQLSYEALVVRKTSEIMTADADEALNELLEELDGTTPADRIRYALGVMRGLLQVFDEAQGELDKEEVDGVRLWDFFSAIHAKQINLVSTLVPDVEQWRAVADWAGQPESPDSANYHSTDAHIYLAMRHLWLGAIWTGYAVVNEDPDVGTAIEFFHRAKGLMEQMASILMRDDVQDALPREEYEAEAGD